jgi:hypothetical protein
MAEYTMRCVLVVYRTLHSKIADLNRDLGFIAHRLKSLEHSLLTANPEDFELTSANLESSKKDKYGTSSSEMSSSQVLRDAAMVLASRLVLPEGQTDIERAAAKFLAQVPEEAWDELDVYLQDNVLRPMGGLFTLCMNNSDLTRTLNGPLLQGTAAYLNKHLEVTDVCQAELSTAQALGVDLSAQTKVFHHLATPSLASRQNLEPEIDFLMVPSTPAGEEFTKLAVKTLPELNVMPINVVTDVLICREQGGLTLGDLQQVFQCCKDDYERNKPSVVSSPHARMDMLDWVPLDP